MDEKFAKRYQKSIFPDKLYRHIKDILNINKRSEYDSYLEKGDKEHSKTSKDKFGTSATIRHLEEAKNYYNSARRSAYSLRQEQVARRRLSDVRNTLSILERRNPRKEKVLGLFSSLDEKLGDLIEEIKEFQKSQKTLPAFIFVSFIFSLFCLSSNITGNVVGSLKQDFSILGIFFFILGLALTFFYARSKR